ncbi:MAG TPA: DUF116 domain-containing protein [Methanothermococcus okinawensis]|uniref:DUF116 domain-containing protein n=1 Tax=Methanothermococcus okinawensis TaxID=155863 RepID=A0A832ZSB7_9EURY|nr:DUF116 domain-containing protein [Methanothermococcus okinawensis]HIP91553.1 DUF116 domain-containing protein [Methanothermococcus okinawensis]
MFFDGLGLAALFEILGIISALLILVGLAIVIITVILGYFLVKKNKLLFPQVFLYIMDNFHPILLKLCLMIGTEDTFYRIGIDFYNRYYYQYFKRAERKVLILPHCLRDIKCPAKLGINGVECVFCNRCPLGSIIKVARDNNYEVYIIPGSTFIKRILKEKNPTGVFGVSCYRDLFYGMNYLSRRGIPVQGQPLLKDGCICTSVDMEELLTRIRDSR